MKRAQIFPQNRHVLRYGGEESADKALYQAKTGGKNRAVLLDATDKARAGDGMRPNR